MKYLLINASPHRGNTWALAELAKARLMEADRSARFQEIHLAELGLPFCLGCSRCFRLGYEKCPHNALIEPVVQAIEWADGVLIASSTCNMRESALLKNLLDHFCFLLHRPRFFRGKALILTTSGGVGHGAAAKSIASTLRGIGFNRCSLFARASFSWNAYLPGERTRAALARATDRFRRDVQSGKLHAPSWGVLMPYNLFRGMSRFYAKGTEYETMDGIHWSERWAGVYDRAVRVPLYKRPLGHFFFLLGRLGGKWMKVTYKK